MFKSYEEPPKPAYDWTDMLVEKGIPLLGTAAGAALGSLVPGGTMPGMAIGSGLGNLVSGLISEKPTSEAKMAKGIQGTMKGYGDWQQLPPERKLDMNESGKMPGAAVSTEQIKIPTIPQMSVSKPEDEEFGAQAFKSTRAPMFAKGSLY